MIVNFELLLCLLLDDVKKNNVFFFHFIGVILLVLRMQKCFFQENIYAFNTKKLLIWSKNEFERGPWSNHHFKN